VNRIEVLAGGMLTTVQDLGRVGSQRYGVPVSGAMDRWSLRAANRIVGNPDGAAALEMTFVGPALRLLDGAMVTLTGADLGPLLDGHPVAAWRSVAVAPGSVLSFAGARDGMRSYLGVAGGIDVPEVLGSRSTFVRSALGGFEGRALRAGDHVAAGSPDLPATARVRRLPRHLVPTYGHVHTLRVVMGPQDGAFSADGVRTFLSGAFTLGLQSDRIGCRFLGPRIEHLEGADIVSDGTAFGSVQVTGDGLPIVLMADRGTTGGYAKIATIASVDLPRLAQATPGDRVRFSRISVEQAQALLRESDARLDEIGRLEPDDESAAAFYEEDSGASLAADAYVDLADALDGEHGASALTRSNVVYAGMSGLVTSVAVSAGDAVTAGQTLLVIEAMKMQNPVRAPRRGRVGRVFVTPGVPVGLGDALVDFEDG
jgi:antagonist of KipI